MTRVAPRSAHDFGSSTPRMLVRWRVGAKDSLQVWIDAPAELEPGHDGSRSMVSAIVTIGASRAVFDGHLEEDQSELRFVSAPPAASSDRSVRCSGAFFLALCDGPGAEPVVLTDLPTRLGLTGGTYVLDHCSSGLRARA